MSQVQRGADQLLVTRRSVVADAFASFFERVHEAVLLVRFQ
jgi:hypothetical protein